MRGMTTDDLYEDDEPLDKVKSDFQSSEKSRTGQVRNGQTVYLALSGVSPATGNQPSGERVHH